MNDNSIRLKSNRCRPATRVCCLLISSLLACVLGVPVQLHAQTLQGTILFERKSDVYRVLHDDQMKATVPHFQTGSYELFFSDSLSIYKAMPKDEAPDPFEGGGAGGGGHVMMKFNGPGDDGALYKNYATGAILEEDILEDKKYLISDSIKAQPWKLSGDTNTILGHTCRKATQVLPRGAKVIAWYAEDLSLPIGPGQFGGLPGAILGVDVDSGGIVYRATQILPSVDGKDLTAPKGGKSITRADFDKKKRELMGPPQGGKMVRREY
jgi:GLPGLI family protein